MQPGDSAGVGTDTGMKSSDRTQSSYSDKKIENIGLKVKKFEGLLKKLLIVLENTYFNYLCLVIKKIT